jgi:hypothetical protein
METFCKIILGLENELSRMKEVSENLPEQMEFAIGHCKITLDRMRELVLTEGFPDRKSEIYFFKKIKPVVYCKLLYFQAVFDIESNRHDKDKDGLRKYFQQRLNKIMDYMTQHHLKVQYFRCNFKHLDDKYFVRHDPEIPLELRDSHSLLDENFFTWHDHTFSTIMANEMLIEYIQKEIEKLDNPEAEAKYCSKFQFQWTGNKIDMVEMLYALHFSKVVNSGQTKIKELAEVFGLVFNIDLTKDIYRFYTEIQQRKIYQTKFLDYLRATLQRKIDDENK